MNTDVKQALRETIEIARVRREHRRMLRDAVVRGEPEDVIRCARLYLGIKDEEAEGNRPTPGFKHGASGS